MAKTVKLALGADLNVPIEMAGQAVACVGVRGSGKTNTAGVIAEELLDHGQQVVVVDPTDAWWGLRSKYPVFIFGGPHGDLPLAETDGKTLAEFVVQEQVPIILSLRHLRKGAQRRLVTEFCEELYHLKGKPEFRTPLTVFIDEAPQFVPQRVMGEMARLVGAVQDMILLGRNAGFGVVMISQRFATLNADVRTQADTIIVHRLPSPLDRKALTEWIEENATIAEQKTVLSSLAKLNTGEAWVWAPYFDLFQQSQIRPRRTFDSSAAPKRGEVARAPKDLKAVDIEKLKGKLSAAIEKAKAEDPKELHKQLAAARAEIAQLHKRAPEVHTAPAKSVPVLTDADREVLKNLTAVLTESRDRITQQSVARFERAVSEAQKAIDSAAATQRDLMGADVDLLTARLEQKGVLKVLAKLEQVSAPTVKHIQPAKSVTALLPRPSAREHNGSTTAEGVTKAEQRVLDAVAWWHAANIQEPTRLQVAMVARYTVNGHFNNLVGGLRTKGLMDYPSAGGVLLTKAGEQAANQPEGELTRDELISRVMQVLRTEPLQRIFGAVVSARNAVSREDLAASTNYTVNGHFNNMVGSLRSLGVVDYPQKGGVQLADMFEALS